MAAKEKLLTIVAIGVFTLSVLQIVFGVFATLDRHNFIDFAVYRGALEKFWQGENPYNFLYAQEEAKSEIPFNYPPSTLVALSFLAVLPWWETQILFLALSFFLLWMALYLTWKMSKIQISWQHFLLILAFFNQTFPVKFTLVLGQINLLVLGVTIASLYLFLRKSKIISPVLLAAAGAIKLFPLITLPLFAFRKEYRFVVLVVLLFIGVSMLPGVALFREYYFVIGPAFSKLSLHNYHDQSIFAFLLRATNDPILAKNIGIAVVVSLYSLLLFAAYRGRKAGDKALLWMFATIFAFTSISNFFSWQHHLVFTYPLILLLYLRTMRPLPFLLVWAGLAFHFKDEHTVLVANPFIVSYQTCMVLGLILASLYVYKKDFLTKK